MLRCLETENLDRFPTATGTHLASPNPHHYLGPSPPPPLLLSSGPTVRRICSMQQHTICSFQASIKSPLAFGQALHTVGQSQFEYSRPCPKRNSGSFVSKGTSSRLSLAAFIDRGRSNGNLPRGNDFPMPKHTSRKASVSLP